MRIAANDIKASFLRAISQIRIKKTLINSRKGKARPRKAGATNSGLTEVIEIPQLLHLFLQVFEDYNIVLQRLLLAIMIALIAKRIIDQQQSLRNHKPSSSGVSR